MYSIYLKEIRSFFNSLIAYLVIVLFLSITGLYIWVIPETVFDGEEASLFMLFDLGPFVFLFLIPAITMRSFSEEKKAGTLELILTKPISELQLVLGKYLANFTLVAFAVIPTLVYYYSLYELGAQQGNIDSAGVFGSYFGLLLLAAVFTSIGVFCSSLTENQIVAFIFTLTLCLFFLFGFSYLTEFFKWGALAVYLDHLGLIEHYTSMSKGVLDSRDVFYFISVVALFLGATRLVLLSRKW